MGREIERKFLVDHARWKPGSVPGERFVQGYLCVEPDRTVRVRTEGRRGVLTIKGRTESLTRPEFEYTIPLADAQELLDLCMKPLIHKTRYRIDVEGSLWEVDVFGGANAGLIVAEIELATEDAHFHRPEWLLKEVTGDARYGNSSLAQAPYTSWRSDL